MTNEVRIKLTDAGRAFLEQSRKATYTETRCDGCRKIKLTKTGFQMPPFFVGPIRLCDECESKILAFMTTLKGDEND